MRIFMVMVNTTLNMETVMFLRNGYLILFKNNYSVINGFEIDRLNKKYNDNYARRVGKIEFISGVGTLIMNFFCYYLRDWRFYIIALIVCIGLPIVLLRVNSIKSKRKGERVKINKGDLEDEKI